jgi:hypothetical protein
MNNKYSAGYGEKMKKMTEDCKRLYAALGISLEVPDYPVTRRYSLDHGKAFSVNE